MNKQTLRNKKEKCGNNTRNNLNVRIKNGASGITLIALVITVIVLLILAAVSIATLTGENGLLAKADEAKTRTAEGQIDEEIRVAYNTVQIDSLNNGWDNDKKAEEMQKELQKQDTSATVTVDGTNLKVSYKSYETTISEDGTIGALTKSKIAINQFKISGTKVTEVPEVAGFTHTEGTIDTGYVIQDGDGNEFVWVPVDKDQKISVNVTSEENITSLVITDPYGDDIVTESSVGEEYNNTEITPTINGPYRLAVTTESGEIKKSFLKVHSLYAVDTMRDWYATDEYAKAQGYADLQALLDDWEYETVEDLMMDGSELEDYYTDTEDYKDKVNTNGGFFIGRYEAGKESDSMVIQKNKDVYNNITQIDALAKAQGYNSSKKFIINRSSMG